MEEIIMASNATDLEDIYFDSYEVDPTPPQPRTIPSAPKGAHPIVKWLHQYFMSLIMELEIFFVNHWGYFLIGLGLFVVFIVIPGVIAQVYCDRLYRKYKREQITRKILEYEAQMEKDSEVEEDEEDDENKRASRRAKHYSESESDSDSDRKGSRGRGHTKNRGKSGKKVRSRSRPGRKHRRPSSEASNEIVEQISEKTEKHEVSVQFKSKKQPKSLEIAPKLPPKQKTRSSGTEPLPVYADHVQKEKKFEESRKKRDSGVSVWDEPSAGDFSTGKFNERYNPEPKVYNDQPPNYFSGNGHPSVTMDNAFPTMSGMPEITNSDFPESITESDCTITEAQNMPFTAVTTSKTQTPMSAKVFTLKEEPLKPNDHRVGYWSAGIVGQYSGARSPVMQKKLKSNPLNLAVVQGATPLTYEEIRHMNQHQIHDDDQKASPPTDYNSNMMSITKSNDDILTELRPKTGPIISNLMPVPEPRENTPAVPALPPKTKPGMQTLSRLPSMELNRTMHNDGAPANSYEGEIVENIKVNQ